MNNFFRALILTTVLLAGGTPTAKAASAVLNTSYWSPADFNSGYGPGIKLQGSVNELFDVEVRATLFPDLGNDVLGGEEPVIIDLAVTPLELGATMNFPYIPDPFIQSYFGGGLGYHQIDLTAEGPVGRINYEVDNEIGFYLVAGIRMHCTPALIMVLEAMQRFVEAEASPVDGEAADRIDMTLNGFGVNFGFGLFW